MGSPTVVTAFETQASQDKNAIDDGKDSPVAAEEGGVSKKL